MSTEICNTGTFYFRTLHSPLTRLVAEGIDVSTADEKGRTALHFASAKGHLRMVETLIKAGADVNKLDHIGNTPLHLASCTNKVGSLVVVARRVYAWYPGLNCPLHLSKGHKSHALGKIMNSHKTSEIAKC